MQSIPPPPKRSASPSPVLGGLAGHEARGALRQRGLQAERRRGSREGEEGGGVAGGPGAGGACDSSGLR